MEPNVEKALSEIAKRHRFSIDATMAMWVALVRGNGAMAQFNHVEFGGAGQWMRGGMTMVGDMFNHSLKARVNDLCNDLSHLSTTSRASEVSPATGGDLSNWWPEHLGTPGSAGGQNTMRYAYFPETRRLAIDAGGQVSIYDTLDHRICGVSQEQASSSSLAFTSQRGRVRLEDLPLVGAGAPRC